MQKDGISSIVHHSVTENGKASCGGLARDSTGQFLGGFAAFLWWCPIAIAELWGVVHALEMAWSMECSNVIMEVDSSYTLQLIQKPLDRRHPYASVIARVHDLLHQNWSIVLQLIYHEANRAADALACMGHSLELGITFYYSVPSRVDSIVSDNSYGVVIP